MKITTHKTLKEAQEAAGVPKDQPEGQLGINGIAYWCSEKMVWKVGHCGDAT